MMDRDARLESLGYFQASAAGLLKIEMLPRMLLLCLGVEFFLRRRLLQFVDEFLHHFFLALNRFDQFELGAAAVEVVCRPMNPEVSVAAQIIRKETEAYFKSDQFARKGNVRFFGFGEEMACAGPISLRHLFEHWHLHFDL